MRTKYYIGLLSLIIGLSIWSCQDEDEYSIQTGTLIQEDQLVTGSSDNVTAISATLNGNISGLDNQSPEAYEIGFYYSTSENFEEKSKATSSLNENGTFTADLTGLTNNVTYYYRSFVVLQKKITYYGDIKNFITTNAKIAVADPTAITAVSASLGGTMTGLNELIGTPSLKFGIAISSTDTTAQSGLRYESKDTTNSFNILPVNLIPNKTYYFAAYITMNGVDTFSPAKTFTTSAFEVEFVDLGLSVLWANNNIGATSDNQLGGLYGWGDATGLEHSTDVNIYGTTENINNTEYDICSANGMGYMPTFTDVKELITRCTRDYTEKGGVKGIKFTGPNGNSIFIPTATGYRNANEISADDMGYYWSSSIEPNSTNFAYTMNLGASEDTWGTAIRSRGLAIRPVKKTYVAFDNSKLNYGDIENKGNFRLEIYNAWGSTGKDPGLDPNNFSAKDAVFVNFTVSGIDSTLNTPATAYIVFADGSWSTQQWDPGNAGDCQVTGDGTYTVSVNGVARGLTVFCVDIVGLATLPDDSTALNNVNAYVNSIYVDQNKDVLYTSSGVEILNENLVAGDIENNGNLRLEIYNTFGATVNNPVIPAESVQFSEQLAVTFTLSGLGDLGDSTYTAFMPFTDANWGHGNWNPGSEGDCEITGDGTYTVYINSTDLSSGALVFCIDIVGILVDGTGVDPNNIVAKIDGINMK
ncbi:MAG: hypothetical protein JW717_00295 [Marinilabiliaceae bacterium]|nr:hypothetical protein [Marinilabiliaceae bacterium]